MSKLGELCQQIAGCRECEALAGQRTKVVPGDGAEDADIMFIGEAPGWHEDQQGRPFVGPAGQYLDQLIASINMKRGQVYITNVIKCRPPGNRDPLPSEMQACRGWLDQQVDLIRPKIIVTLGRYSMALYFPGKTISRIHGTAQRRDNIIYYAMYHQAAALHQQSLRPTIEADMLRLPSLLVQTEAVPEVREEPQQLNLFEV